MRLINAELVEIVLKHGYHQKTPKEQAETNIMMDVIDKIETVTRATELLEADKDGRVTVLPCKVGDTVYIIDMADCKSGECPDIDDKKCLYQWGKSFNGAEIVACRVKHSVVREVYVCELSMHTFDDSEDGEAEYEINECYVKYFSEIYSTYEEAESALKKKS